MQYLCVDTVTLSAIHISGRSWVPAVLESSGLVNILELTQILYWKRAHTQSRPLFPPPPPPPHYIHSFYFPRFFLLVQFTTFDEHYVSSVLSLSRLSPQDVTTWLFLVLAWLSYVAFGDELIVPGVVLANKLLFEFWEDRETSPSKYVFVNRNVRLIY